MNVSQNSGGDLQKLLYQNVDNVDWRQKKRSEVYNEIKNKLNTSVKNNTSGDLKETIEKIKDLDYDLSCPITKKIIIPGMGWLTAIGVVGIIMLAGMGVTSISLYSIPAVGVVVGGVGMPIAFKVDSCIRNNFNKLKLAHNDDVDNLENAVKRTVGNALLDAYITNDTNHISRLSETATTLGLKIVNEDTAWVLKGAYPYDIVQYK